MTNSGGKTILVVSDSTDQTRFMETAFRLAGYTVAAASCENEAFRAAESQNIDLIVSDLSAPNRDGIELCRRIRADGRLRLMPILLVSNLGNDSESVIRGLEAGADEYLALPCDPLLLVAKVSLLLGRREMVGELRKSEEKFRTVFENAPLGIALVGTDGICMDSNPALQDMLGYSANEVNGLPVTFFTHPDDTSNDQELAAEVLEGKRERYQVEKRFRNRSGRIVWGNLNVSAVRDSNGEVQFLVGMVKDITDQKRAEESLRRSQERFHLVSTATNDAFWDWDLERNELWVNDSHSVIMGYDRASITPTFEMWKTALHPDDRDRVVTALEAAIARGQESWSDEYRIRRPDGAEVYIHDRGRLIYDSGKLVRMIGGMVDVTERRRAEELIEQSERDYRTIFEQAHDAIIIFEPIDGTILDANERAWRMYGSHRREFIGMSMLDFVNGVDAARECIGRLLAGGEQLNFETVHRRSDGSEMHLEINTSLIYYQGKPAIISINRDITERKHVSEQLRKKDELLRQSQKLESVGRLAGGIAHDFNNMLTAINGYSELILRKPNLDDSIRRAVEEIRKAGERSASLTNQLLAFSRRQVLQTKVLDINEVIAETSKLLGRLIGEDIKLTTSLSADLWSVEVDPGQLTQVIMNLAVNARDAMQNGGSLLIATDNVLLDERSPELRGLAKPGDYVRLIVSDSGHGIAGDDLQHIFEPFFTTKELGKGTGLGLATVYGIVKQSGGYIWVDSELGAGTKFTIYLPRVADSQRDREQETSSVIPRGAGTILVVEDEYLVRSLTRQVLEQCGYRVVEASDGVEALTKCEQLDWKIDLLMTDVVMPNMGGRELASAVAESGSQIPVLFTSGYTDDHVIRHDVISPHVNFLQKPFTVETLAHKVQEMLGNPN